MAKEIERKFLVANDTYLEMETSRIEIIQGYLCRDPESTVRVRVTGDKACLTVKGPNTGAVRDEWEFAIDPPQARQMLASVARGPVIEKTRHIVPFGGLVWEVDEFHGQLAGLCIAEVELPTADTEVAIPPFAGSEVTGNPAYYNSNLNALPDNRYRPEGGHTL